MTAWVCTTHGVRDHAYCRAFYGDPTDPDATVDLSRWTTIPHPSFNPWPPSEVPPVGSDVPIDTGVDGPPRPYTSGPSG